MSGNCSLVRWAVFLMLSTGLIWARQDSGQNMPATPPKYDPVSVERGKQLFVSTCGFCHGANAKGGEKGPDLLRSVVVLDDEHGQSIAQVVRKGRVEKGMPKFNLTSEQVADLANFLHNAILAAADRDSYKVLNIVTGDPKAGEAYFNGTGRCSSCHSTTGDLKGIGSKYEPVTLQDRFLAPNGQWTDPTTGEKKSAYSVTVTLPSGETFTGFPVTLDDFNVSLRDGKGVYHSFKRTKDMQVNVQNALQPHLDMLMTYKEADIHNLTAYLVTLK